MNWLITIPKTIPWTEYQKELASVADGSSVMNYRTRYFPKEMKIGDRCYILWDGKIRGWMLIVGLVEKDKIWETSWTRRFLLIVFTYLAIGFYLQAININNAWLNAIVPAVGFLLSTLTLPFFKKLWMQHMLKEKKGKR